MDFLNEFEAKQRMAQEYLASILPDETLRQGEVVRAMHYSLSFGGKRIRPVLTLAACEALGGRAEEALPLAGAVEMIHTYSLIHDDLPCMDNDDLRRGRASNHKVFGEATALLAGDALLTFAFESVLASPLADEKKTQALYVLAHHAGVFGMIGGQVLDMEGERRPLSADDLATMHAMKTGALIRAAVSMGCIAAGGEALSLDVYADYLGRAFQLKDDLLDATATTSVLGKTAGSDAKNDKSTFLRLYGEKRTGIMLQEATQKAIDALCGRSEFLKQLAVYLLERTK